MSTMRFVRFMPVVGLEPTRREAASLDFTAFLKMASHYLSHYFARDFEKWSLIFSFIAISTSVRVSLYTRFIT